MLFISLIDIKLFQQNAHMFGGGKRFVVIVGPMSAKDALP